MRKITVLSFITLGGVMQAPGEPEEDTSKGFKYGGWSAPYADEIFGKMMEEQMKPTGLLLGRKTFEIFASYWPEHANNWPGINDVTKYVLSNTVKKSDWQNTIFLTSMVDIEKLKNSTDSDIKIWGSSKLVQPLLKDDLVGEFWLNVPPLLLGKRKKLFDKDTTPTAFKLIADVTH